MRGMIFYREPASHCGQNWFCHFQSNLKNLEMAGKAL